MERKYSFTLSLSLSQSFVPLSLSLVLVTVLIAKKVQKDICGKKIITLEFLFTCVFINFYPVDITA